MKIYSVFEKEFAPYGKIVTGLEQETKEILEVLQNTPLPDSVIYVAEDRALQNLSAAEIFSKNLYGGMPVQMGYCNGHNKLLNCLEYHKDSEYNLGTEDFVLLLAKIDEIEDGVLDTAKVKAFHVPAGTLIECYATTLHYCPCHVKYENGFRMLVALPKGTNTDCPEIQKKTKEDALLFARNKWLLAHKDAPEANDGAYVGLMGENISL